MPTLIRYPAFRDFSKWRVQTNDAIAAAFVATQIGATEAARMVAGGVGEELLSDAFPTVADARTMSVKLSKAVDQFAESESFLAAMAIPFAVSVYNDLLVDAARLLQIDGQLLDIGNPEARMLGPLRGDLRRAGLTPESDAESLVDFVQALRNKIIHSGGVATAGLAQTWQKVALHAQARWIRTAGAPILVPGKRVQLAYPEVRATLAALYRSVIEVNGALATSVSRATWLRVAVDDVLSQVSVERSTVRAAMNRRARKFLALHYRPIGLTDDEIDRELARRPVWRADGLYRP